MSGVHPWTLSEMELLGSDPHHPGKADLHGRRRGLGYGDTLTWTDKLKPATGVCVVHAQLDLDRPRFQNTFVELMSK